MMGKPAIPALDESNFDFSLLEQTSRMSYEERLEAHESARELVVDLQKAGRDFRAKQSETAS